jgi:hypothetical protein
LANATNLECITQVSFRGQSGRDLLVTSITAFDPNRPGARGAGYGRPRQKTLLFLSGGRRTACAQGTVTFSVIPGEPAMRKPDPELLPIQRPRCPRCQARMLTTKVENAADGFENAPLGAPHAVIPKRKRWPPIPLRLVLRRDGFQANWEGRSRPTTSHPKIYQPNCRIPDYQRIIN